MNILLVSPLPPPAGGIATWTNSFINSEQAKYNNVEVINTSVIGERSKCPTKKNIKDEVLRTINIIKEVKLKLKKSNIDIVHVNTSCSKFGMLRDLLCIKQLNNKRTKVIVHFHCDTNYMVKGKFSSIMFKKLCEEADKVFVLNKSSYNHIKRVTNKEIKIIPNFINSNDFKFVGERIISSEIKNILFVGHVMKRKGCEEIISIARKMPNKNFTMVGHLSDEIKKISKPKNVSFLGELPHSKIVDIMNKHDLFLFPTHTEGFPNVILEAMICGMPIVSTNVGAIPDMIENKGGIIVNVKDEKAVIMAINELEDLNKRIEFGTWNKNKVMKNYTLDIIMNKILEEYNSIL